MARNARDVMQLDDDAAPDYEDATRPLLALLSLAITMCVNDPRNHSMDVMKDWLEDNHPDWMEDRDGTG